MPMKQTDNLSPGDHHLSAAYSTDRMALTAVPQTLSSSAICPNRVLQTLGTSPFEAEIRTLEMEIEGMLEEGLR